MKTSSDVSYYDAPTGAYFIPHTQLGIQWFEDNCELTTPVDERIEVTAEKAIPIIDAMTTDGLKVNFNDNISNDAILQKALDIYKSQRPYYYNSFLGKTLWDNIGNNIITRLSLLIVKNHINSIKPLMMSKAYLNRLNYELNNIHSNSNIKNIIVELKGYLEWQVADFENYYQVDPDGYEKLLMLEDVQDCDFLYGNDNNAWYYNRESSCRPGLQRYYYNYLY